MPGALPFMGRCPFVARQGGFEPKALVSGLVPFDRVFENPRLRLGSNSVFPHF